MLRKINDYPAYLEACWREHLKPRKKKAPTVISLFAGAGGSSLGYSMAGFRELLAVEWDDNAVETFKLNFPDVPIYHGDIAKLSVKECLKMTGLKPGELDVLDGSPPCQGFSTAGKRQLDDPRNQLFREYVRLLRGLKPRTFIMENVSGMVRGIMKLLFVEILKELKDCGYLVSAKVLNSKYFAVPQSRERMIFIGIRRDMKHNPSHPSAETYPINVWTAFQNIKDKGDCPGMSEKYVDYWRKAGQGGVVGKQQSHKRLSWSRPSFVLQKASGYGGIYHPDEPRPLSTLERKRLGSFPLRFQFTNWNMAIERIGNSVPPLFMRSIALHVKEHILKNV